MIEITRFSALEDGPHILIIGSIHGDEKCGTIAIEDAIEKFHNETWKTKNGTITFLPRANYEAFRQNTRQIAYNLNRIFGEREIISTEHKVAKKIEKYILEADYVIDLHSVYTGDTPFVFLESEDETMKNFAKKISVPYIMTGWDKIYAETTDVDTVTFANQNGIPGVTIECGSHKTDESIRVAKAIIHEALEFF